MEENERPGRKMIEAVAQYRKMIAEALAQAKESVPAGLKDLSMELFEIAPEIRSVFWTQYTPGFNDGDPCEFTMGDLEISLVGVDEDDEDYYDDYDSGPAFIRAAKACLRARELGMTFPAEDDETREELYQSTWGFYGAKFFEAVASKIENLPRVIEILEGIDNCREEDLMKDLFGNDVKVIISAGGIEVEEYDCGY